MAARASSKGRRAAIAAGLLFASTLVALISGELIFRSIEPPPILTEEVVNDRVRQDAALYEPADQPLGYVPAPGREAGPGKINALGLRDREYERTKPEGVFRVVLLGDSVTWGAGIPQNQTFENLLEDRLVADGHKLEILNLGVPGYNATMMAAYLERRGLALNPDLVLAVIGLNDEAATPVVVWEPDRARYKYFDGSGSERVPWVFDFPGARWLMSNSALYRGVCRRLASPHTAVFDSLRHKNRQDMLRIVALAEAQGGKAALVLLPEFRDFEPYPRQAEHLDLATFLGNRVTLIDLLPGLTRATGGNGRSLRFDARDAIHPDREAQDIIADLLHGALLERELLP